MPSWRFWERDDKANEPAEAAAATSGRFKVRPRSDLRNPSAADPARAEQVARLRARREAALFDVQQSELAKQPANPWRERVALIEQTMAIVVSDLEALTHEHGVPGHPLPTTPVEELNAEEGPPPVVTFQIGGERFRFEEDLDWAERGSQIARSDLQLRHGDTFALLPDTFPEQQRTALAAHLSGSLFMFATDIRDRMLAGDPLPHDVTLADLAKPAATEGGWLDWAGHSPAAQERGWRRHDLEAERNRLLAERDGELEEQARWVERRPVALRRLRDVDNEFAALEGSE